MAEGAEEKVGLGESDRARVSVGGAKADGVGVPLVDSFAPGVCDGSTEAVGRGSHVGRAHWDSSELPDEHPNAVLRAKLKRRSFRLRLSRGIQSVESPPRKHASRNGRLSSVPARSHHPLPRNY